LSSVSNARSFWPLFLPLLPEVDRTWELRRYLRLPYGFKADSHPDRPGHLIGSLCVPRKKPEFLRSSSALFGFKYGPGRLLQFIRPSSGMNDRSWWFWTYLGNLTFRASWFLTFSRTTDARTLPAFPPPAARRHRSSFFLGNFLFLFRFPLFHPSFAQPDRFNRSILPICPCAGEKETGRTDIFRRGYDLSSLADSLSSPVPARGDAAWGLAPASRKLRHDPGDRSPHSKDAFQVPHFVVGFLFYLLPIASPFSFSSYHRATRAVETRDRIIPLVQEPSFMTTTFNTQKRLSARFRGREEIQCTLKFSSKKGSQYAISEQISLLFVVFSLSFAIVICCPVSAGLKGGHVLYNLSFYFLCAVRFLSVVVVKSCWQ